DRTSSQRPTVAATRAARCASNVSWSFTCSMVHCPPFLYQRRVTMTLLTRHPEVPERSEGLEGRRPGAQISLCSLRKLDCGGRSSFEAPPALASLGRDRSSATLFFFKRAAPVFCP